MSIEVDKTKFAAAMHILGALGYAIGKLLVVADEAVAELRGELAFGADLATPDGQALEQVVKECEAFRAQLHAAHLETPDVGRALALLTRHDGQPRQRGANLHATPASESQIPSLVS